MTQRRFGSVARWCAAGVVCCWPGVVLAQWVTFTNQTASRLSAPPGLGSTDPEEKNYAVGDVDNDGDWDVVAVRKQPYTTTGGKVNVLFRNINGVLTDVSSVPATSLVPQFNDLTPDRDAKLVDVNGDDWLDIVTGVSPQVMTPVTNNKLPRVYINLGESGGVWQGFTWEAGRMPTVSPLSNSCALDAADVDLDGDMDLYFNDYSNSAEDRIYINDGAGFFTNATATRMTTASAQTTSFNTHIRFADMNGDGLPDIMRSTAGSVSYLRNTNNGFFLTSTTVSNGSDYFVDAGDLNNDGKLDLVVEDDNVNRYMINTGNNAQGNPNYMTYTAPTTTGGFGGRNQLADLNNDGKLDWLLPGNDIDAQGCVAPKTLKNTFNGTTVGWDAANNPLSSFTGIFDIAVIDIDNDGFKDMVVGKCGGTTVLMQTAPNPPPTITSVVPANGTIDVLQDETTAGVLQGHSQMTFTFSGPVFSQTGGAPKVSDFVVTDTLGLPPTVTSVTPAGPPNSYVVTFNRPITPGAWTTVVGSGIVNAAGVHLPFSTGDRSDVGALPGDANASTTVSPQDVLAIVTALNNGTANLPQNVVLMDMNRTGIVSAQDSLRLVQLLNGVMTSQAWNGVALPSQP